MRKNGRIILSGGGDIDVSFKLDEKFFSLLRDNAQILYIPVALNRTKLGFEGCYDWFSNIISQHSGKKDIDFTMLLDGDNVPDFDRYDSVYIGGGNTYKLLDYVYKNNIGKKITEYIKNGGIVYGGSAGAIILGKNIKTAEEENDNNYVHSDGLNLVENRSVICHYTESLDEKIFETAKRINSIIIALPENAGLILGSNGKILEIVGNVFVFDEKSKKQI